MSNQLARSVTPAHNTEEINNPPINCTFSKVMYRRLYNYAKLKGIKEQEVIRFATAMFLDKIEGRYNTV